MVEIEDKRLPWSEKNMEQRLDATIRHFKNELARIGDVDTLTSYRFVLDVLHGVKGEHDETKI